MTELKCHECHNEDTSHAEAMQGDLYPLCEVCAQDSTRCVELQAHHEWIWYAGMWRLTTRGYERC